MTAHRMAHALFFALTALYSVGASAQASEAQTAEAQASEARTSEAQVSETQGSAAQVSAGQPASASDGQAADAKAPASEAPASEAQPTDAQPAAAKDAAAPQVADEPSTGKPAEGTASGPVLPDVPELEDVTLGSDGGPAVGKASDSSAKKADTPVIKNMMQARFLRAANTSIGGYAELHGFQNLQDFEDPAQVNFKRMVLFVAHHFTEDIRFYTEMEVEHAMAGQGRPGYFGVEQAFLDWDLIEDLVTLRAGMILVPMGIVNQWHEPPLFGSVDRPALARRIIPSTWREAGIGITGQPTDWMKYELYLMTGLNPLGFNLELGMAQGRQHLAQGLAAGPALSGRLEFEPALGHVFGIAGYAGRAVGTLGEMQTPNGETLDAVNVFGGSLDARGKAAGFEWRLSSAAFALTGTDTLRRLESPGNVSGADIGSFMYGAYAEVGYDVLHYVDTDMQLMPFFRLERTDTAAGIEGRDKTVPDTRFAQNDIVVGLNLRPIPLVVFKGDVVHRINDDGSSATIGGLGLGLMF